MILVVLIPLASCFQIGTVSIIIIIFFKPMPLTSAYQGKKRRKCNIKNGEPNLTYAALSEEL